MARVSSLAALLLSAATAAGISPSCMMNGFGCPLPVGWSVDWSLRNSTIAMPEAGGAGVNGSGFWPAAGHHWGALGADLTFTDDRDGIPVEHPQLPATLGLSAAEVAQVQFATQQAGQWLATSLAAVGKTCWDCLGGYELGPRPVQGASCAPTMRALCDPAAQGRSMLMGYSGRPGAQLNQSLAAFLVARPPVAFFGSRWQDDMWDVLFDMDVGEPLEPCAEGPEGVFSRRWTGGTAALDCNAWQASLPFAMLPAAR